MWQSLQSLFAIRNSQQLSTYSDLSPSSASSSHSGPERNARGNGKVNLCLRCNHLGNEYRDYPLWYQIHAELAVWDSKSHLLVSFDCTSNLLLLIPFLLVHRWSHKSCREGHYLMSGFYRNLASPRHLDRRICTSDFEQNMTTTFYYKISCTSIKHAREAR